MLFKGVSIVEFCYVKIIEGQRCPVLRPIPTHPSRRSLKEVTTLAPQPGPKESSDNISASDSVSVEHQTDPVLSEG